MRGALVEYKCEKIESDLGQAVSQPNNPTSKYHRHDTNRDNQDTKNNSDQAPKQVGTELRKQNDAANKSPVKPANITTQLHKGTTDRNSEHLERPGLRTRPQKSTHAHGQSKRKGNTTDTYKINEMCQKYRWKHA